jgi:hypothetical protein
MFKEIKRPLFVLSFLAITLILISCDFSKTEPIKISVKVINSDTKEPRVGDTVIVRKIEKPWYKMWQYIEVADGTTDSLGIVCFTIDRNKGHSFVSYGPYPEFGSTEYDEQELNENDEIIIEVIPSNKKKFKL